MKAAVIGATGTIGKAIAALLGINGHEVVPVTRHSEPAVDIDDPASIDVFYHSLGEVDAIVCAAGSASFGPLTDLSDADFKVSIDSKLLGQVNLVRKGLEAMRPGGAFVLTGGIFAYQPWPKTSAIAMVNAGLEGFVRGAALDLQDRCRVVVVHPPLVRETAIQMGMDGADYPDAATVAGTYAKALDSGITGQPVFVEGYPPRFL